MAKIMSSLNDYEIVDRAARDSVANLKNEILKSIYSVGDIIVTINSVNPSNRFGGTWEQFGQGRTLIGVGDVEDHNTARPYNFEVLQTGGEYTHALTKYELPDHDHSILVVNKSGNKPIPYKEKAILGTTSNTYDGSITRVATTTYEYNDYPLDHNNIQPYIAVYFWRKVKD